MGRKKAPKRVYSSEEEDEAELELPVAPRTPVSDQEAERGEGSCARWQQNSSSSEQRNAFCAVRPALPAGPTTHCISPTVDYNAL